MVEVIVNVLVVPAIPLRSILWHFVSHFLRALYSSSNVWCMLLSIGAFHLYLHYTAVADYNRTWTVLLNVCATSHQLWHFDICRTFILIRKKGGEEKHTIAPITHSTQQWNVMRGRMTTSCDRASLRRIFSFFLKSIQIIHVMTTLSIRSEYKKSECGSEEVEKCEFGRWVYNPNKFRFEIRKN